MLNKTLSKKFDITLEQSYADNYALEYAKNGNIEELNNFYNIYRESEWLPKFYPVEANNSIVAYGFAVGGHHGWVETLRDKHNANSLAIAFGYIEGGYDSQVQAYCALTKEAHFHNLIARRYAGLGITKFFTFSDEGEIKLFNSHKIDPKWIIRGLLDKSQYDKETSYDNIAELIIQKSIDFKETITILNKCSSTKDNGYVDHVEELMKALNRIERRQQTFFASTATNAANHEDEPALGHEHSLTGF